MVSIDRCAGHGRALVHFEKGVHARFGRPRAKVIFFSLKSFGYCREIWSPSAILWHGISDKVAGEGEIIPGTAPRAAEKRFPIFPALQLISPVAAVTRWTKILR